MSKRPPRPSYTCFCIPLPKIYLRSSLLQLSALTEEVSFSPHWPICLGFPLDSSYLFLLLDLSIFFFLIIFFRFSVDWNIGFGDCGSVSSEAMGLFYFFFVWLLRKDGEV